MEGDFVIKPPVTPQKSPKRFKAWLVSHKKIVIIAVIALLVLVLSAFTWFGRDEGPVEASKVQPTSEPKELPSLINGVVVDRSIYNRHPVAVMIENSPAARPQTGLTSADVVYEAVTEGGITRFMALYSINLPTKVGPVRSARSYFIDYLSEYDAFYAHAGGSPTALSRIGEYKIKDYPHSNDAYWREPRKGVASEHTLFADVSKIFNLGVEKKGWSATADFKSWLFKDASATPAPAAAVNIKFSSAQFNVVWNFDPVTKLYSRSMGGAVHKDATSGEQITAAAVLALKVSHSANPAYKGTGKESEWNMSTIGEGEAMLFQDGTAVNATWKKPARTERTRLYDKATGAELKINRGRIWVEIVPQEGSYSQG
ncbi:MAG: DUF3048 domain-containing protein [Candidatus Berkelbacteria bacterium]|nr:MAG: DUF3048 domain-containing protein [Candidatus Berkelbacteria bacterium]QQG51406.1 MAG: DUF3048 domain-containing protein [Candidatus Berkelbacteria bacterium]